ncbi:uncharacterized protein LOC127260240 isoform X3 [Andrographis paniculata]|uniref:uncharacterized protein LOC127260240 isoform X3 n=1 Tax=Andrographis paniculata TaxID=175694 RepID=UPI0021E96723|nr:uncharacterized protein LOC127260240 isoform X3 [Andrographis paniculata]
MASPKPRRLATVAIWRCGFSNASPYGVTASPKPRRMASHWWRSGVANTSRVGDVQPIYTLRNPQRSHNISAILGRSRGKDEAEERALHLIKEVLPVSMLKITSTGIRITSNRHMNQYPVDVLYLHYFQLFRSDEINDPTLFLW